MKWIKLSNRVPDIQIDGVKILIYRIVNDSQENIAMSIHDTHMIKFCDANETRWMSLPDKPVLALDSSNK